MKVKPNLNNLSLTRKIFGFDESLKKKKIDVIEERPVTLFLNSQEIVTMMTINDYPEYLALGYLLNQNMISTRTKIKSVEYHSDISTIVVRTNKITNFEEKLKKKIITSGCAQGTVFGDLMSNLKNFKFKNTSRIKKSWIYDLSKKINLTPSLYLKAGAIHSNYHL